MMTNEFDDLNQEDKLKAENDFLKMKMMLEKGAEFGGMGNTEHFTPEMENMFLKNIINFEEQLESSERVTVFERIGKPDHFPNPADISDTDLEIKWMAINELLNGNGITLDCCSPNISKRELYRFIIEELFQEEVDKVSLEGWYTTFIYDEFHPDPYYDNITAAIEECNQILGNESMQWLHNFRKLNLKLNDHFPLTENELRDMVNRFKAAYDSLEVIEIKENFCEVHEDTSVVKGNYSVDAVIGKEAIQLAGSWSIEFQFDKTVGYWYINEVQMPGIRF